MSDSLKAGSMPRSALDSTAMPCSAPSAASRASSTGFRVPPPEQMSAAGRSAGSRVIASTTVRAVSSVSVATRSCTSSPNAPEATMAASTSPRSKVSRPVDFGVRRCEVRMPQQLREQPVVHAPRRGEPPAVVEAVDATGVPVDDRVDQAVSGSAVERDDVAVGADELHVRDAAEVDRGDAAALGPGVRGQPGAVEGRHEGRPLAARGDVGHAYVGEYGHTRALGDPRGISELQGAAGVPGLDPVVHGLAVRDDEVGRDARFADAPSRGLGEGLAQPRGEPGPGARVEGLPRGDREDPGAEVGLPVDGLGVAHGQPQAATGVIVDRGELDHGDIDAVGGGARLQ